MDKTKDKLTKCPCGKSDACYTQNMGPSYALELCYGCGFTTNTLMKEDSKFLSEQLEVLPELYKDLMFVDDKDYHWIPNTVNIPDKGMVYVNGTTTNNWKWTAVKAIPLLEEETSKFPEGTTHKMDMKNAEHFSERDYMEALDYIGIFEKQ